MDNPVPTSSNPPPPQKRNRIPLQLYTHLRTRRSISTDSCHGAAEEHQFCTALHCRRGRRASVLYSFALQARQKSISSVQLCTAGAAEEHQFCTALHCRRGRRASVLYSFALLARQKSISSVQL